MSMIIDVIVIALIVILTLIYAKKGLFKVLIGIAGFIISIVLASALCRPIATLIKPLIADAVDGIHIDNSLINKFTDTLVRSQAVATVLAFGIVFLIATLLCKLIGLLAGGIGKLPLIGKIDHLLGGILGFLLGLCYAQVLAMVLFCFSEYLIGTFGWLDAEAFDGSIVAKWLFEHNLFTYIFG